MVYYEVIRRHPEYQGEEILDFCGKEILVLAFAGVPTEMIEDAIVVEISRRASLENEVAWEKYLKGCTNPAKVRKIGEITNLISNLRTVVRYRSGISLAMA